MKKPEVGARYRHFKSTSEHPMEYIVRGIARYSESEGELEEMVVYEAQYENKLGKLCVRPLAMWFEEVDRPEYSYKGPRFVKIEPKSAKK